MSVTADPNLAASPDPADSKTCDHCGTEFYRRKKFAKAAFARQRFCCRGCSLQGMDRPKTRKATAPKVKPKLAAAPAPKPVVVVPERPVWRPSGFAPQPVS